MWWWPRETSSWWQGPSGMRRVPPIPQPPPPPLEPCSYVLRTLVTLPRYDSPAVTSVSPSRLDAMEVDSRPTLLVCFPTLLWRVNWCSQGFYTYPGCQRVKGGV
jgi:hypothetical protein